jgi:hypothetical protein
MFFLFKTKPKIPMVNKISDKFIVKKKIKNISILKWMNYLRPSLRLVY